MKHPLFPLLLVGLIVLGAGPASAACTPDCTGGGTFGPGVASVTAPYCTANTSITIESPTTSDSFTVTLGSYGGSDEYTCGQYANGDWWILAKGSPTGVRVQSVSSTGTGNFDADGCANINWDQQCFNLGSNMTSSFVPGPGAPFTYGTDDHSFPISYVHSANRSNVGSATGYDCSPSGSVRTCMLFVGVLTFESSIPDTDADSSTFDEFRPAWLGEGNTKLGGDTVGRYNMSTFDANQGTWPAFSKTPLEGGGFPTLTSTANVSQTIRPLFQVKERLRVDQEVPDAHFTYPGATDQGATFQTRVAKGYMTAAIRLMLDDVTISTWGEGRRGVIGWVQQGIDWAQAQRNGYNAGLTNSQSAGWGGQMHGHKVKMAAAVKLLNDPALNTYFDATRRGWFMDRLLHIGSDGEPYWGDPGTSSGGSSRCTGGCSTGRPLHCGDENETFDSACCPSGNFGYLSHQMGISHVLYWVITRLDIETANNSQDVLDMWWKAWDTDRDGGGPHLPWPANGQDSAGFTCVGSLNPGRANTADGIAKFTFGNTLWTTYGGEDTGGGPTNANPVISSPSVDSPVNEDTTSNAWSMSVDDADVDNVSCSIKVGSETNLSVACSSCASAAPPRTCSGTFDPDPNFNGAASFTVQATDGIATVEHLFLVTVDSVNDAPAVANIGGGDPLPAGWTDAYALRYDTAGIGSTVTGAIPYWCVVDGTPLAGGDTFSYATANNDPFQVSFYDEFAALLPFERIVWNTSGESCWALRTNIAPNPQSDYDYVVIGKPGVSDEQNVAATWIDYSAVCHMESTSCATGQTITLNGSATVGSVDGIQRKALDCPGVSGDNAVVDGGVTTRFAPRFAFLHDTHPTDFTRMVSFDHDPGDGSAETHIQQFKSGTSVPLQVEWRLGTGGDPGLSHSSFYSGLQMALGIWHILTFNADVALGLNPTNVHGSRNGVALSIDTNINGTSNPTISSSTRLCDRDPLDRTMDGQLDEFRIPTTHLDAEYDILDGLALAGTLITVEAVQGAQTEQQGNTFTWGVGFLDSFCSDPNDTPPDTPLSYQYVAASKDCGGDPTLNADGSGSWSLAGCGLGVQQFDWHCTDDGTPINEQSVTPASFEVTVLAGSVQFKASKGIGATGGVIH